MTDEPKFCKDCKHFRGDPIHDRCMAPKALLPVDGNGGFPRILRSWDGDHPDYCGRQAKWFEPAPPKPPLPPARWWEFWK